MDLKFLPRKSLYSNEILNTLYDKLKKRNDLIKSLLSELDKVDEPESELNDRRTERLSKISKRNKYQI
jgi:hypothetical protein